MRNKLTKLINSFAKVLADIKVEIISKNEVKLEQPFQKI